MQDVLPVIVTIMLSVLTIMMVIVGVLAIQVLWKVKQTLQRFDDTIDLIEDKIIAVVSPLQSLGGMAASLKTGMQVFESFLGWMNRSKKH